MALFHGMRIRAHTTPRSLAFVALLTIVLGLALPRPLVAGPEQSSPRAPAAPAASPKVAYVYRGNTSDATTFRSLLTGEGYSVDLVPLSAVLTTDFNIYDLIIIAHDTGDLAVWGTDPAQVTRITAPNKPLLGLGEGGYAFFGKLSLPIGWPLGWHGPQLKTVRTAAAPPAYFSVPYAIPGDPVQIYTSPVDEVGIYLGSPNSPPPATLIPIGLEPASPDHAPLIADHCHQLWGFAGNPQAMTADGRHLFANAVHYAATFQCAAPPPPPDPKCLTVVKRSDPAPGTAVVPGQVVAYTLAYTLACQASAGKLVDTVPQGTTFVPGSASDGISPGVDGALIWTAAPGSGTKTFKVFVDETACRQGVISNHATLSASTAPLDSNVVTHKVNCPPVLFPNDQPSYAESEIQIHPYPLVTGKPSSITVRVSNSAPVSQTLNVSFQTSPDRFGIGLSFNTFDSRVVTVPANSSVIVASTFTPVSSGHYCIQVAVQSQGGPVVVTQQNLDVTEDLRPGVEDTLIFKVGNPTGTLADINLVVVNTCPGWTASVSPATLTAVGPNDSDIRSASLMVTPPNPAVLGSGCHIDVQGWIGDRMIGGIRKLDVPPVHLPVDVRPAWEESEISTIPNPPAVGQPGQICVQLQNPLGTSRSVTLDYQVADFGAGVPFTSVGSQTVMLPPSSLADYCQAWTPAAGGTLHRCIRVQLSQAGYLNQASRRNVDLVTAPPGRPDLVDVPFIIGNPDGVPHHLVLQIQSFGVDPYWRPVIVPDPGDPPPDLVLGDGSVRLHLQFAGNMLAAQAQQAPPADFHFGDRSQVEVTALLDGVPSGGMTVQLLPRLVFLPLLRK